MPGKPYVTLVNINKNKGMLYGVYIGRSSYTKNFWGNDFVIGINGNRATVIEKFERIKECPCFDVITEMRTMFANSSKG